MSEFDKFDVSYEDILNNDVRFSGDSAEYFADYKARFVLRTLGAGFKGRILDYGCGVGLVVRSLKELSDNSEVHITGFDVSKGAIGRASKEISGVMFTSDPKEVGKASFDAVIVANVMHHVVPGQRCEFLRTVAGFLNTDGHIFIFEHNPYNPLTLFVVKRSVLDKEASLLTLREVEKGLTRTGISVILKKYIVFFPRCLKSLRYLEPALGAVPMGAQYVCVGRKLS